ncbi:MAG: carbon storage regulator [Oscillospiraceae bacterium]|nr:carbon storage regulator [Oscillospiraceae bacterium]
MLVLGRNPGESVMIGDDIVVKVIKKGGDLKLAITAPPELPVLRGEVYKKEKEKDMQTQAKQVF